MWSATDVVADRDLDRLLFLAVEVMKFNAGDVLALKASISDSRKSGMVFWRVFVDHPESEVSKLSASDVVDILVLLLGVLFGELKAPFFLGDETFSVVDRLDIVERLFLAGDDTAVSLSSTADISWSITITRLDFLLGNAVVWDFLALVGDFVVLTFLGDTSW